MKQKKKKNLINHSSSGFTLIELLVVIAIIGLLASVVLVALNGARSKARDAKRKSDLVEIQEALELYYNSNNDQYPVSTGATSPNNSWSNSNDASWNTLTAALSPYISKLPHDPKEDPSGYPGTGNFSYAYYSDPTGFYGCQNQEYILAGELENAPATLPPVFISCNGSNVGLYGNLMLTNKVR